MLAGTSPRATGKKTSWPEQPITIAQLADDVGNAVAIPLAVKVVAKVVVKVVELATVVSARKLEVEVTTVVVSSVEVAKVPLKLFVMVTMEVGVNVTTVSIGSVAMAELAIIVSRVSVGTETTWFVDLPPAAEVALSKGANVEKGCRGIGKALGILVGNGWTTGFPAVSSVVAIV